MTIDHLPGQIEAVPVAALAPQSADPAMLGASKYPRRKGDFYATEPWVTECLMRNVELRDTVWEPACGEGHMSRVLEREYHVHSTTLHDQGYGHKRGVDFLANEYAPMSVQSIVTNPPYSHADEFVEHAIRLMDKRSGIVAMLLRNEWDSAATRSHLFKATNGFDMKIALTRRPRWVEGSTGSPRHNFAWFIWDFGRINGRKLLVHDQ